jgi:precorrin-4/cobalt-precorrin-4 C11-methyltransferase
LLRSQPASGREFARLFIHNVDPRQTARFPKGGDTMKVYFIGAGPGAHDLITLRGAHLLGQARLVLYAGSLVSKEMLVHCHANAEIIDTAKLDLDQQEVCYRRAKENDWDVARLHSGDPAIYGATAEQMRRLDNLGLQYEVVPGISSFLSAAAGLNAELTKPGVSQTIILTRTTGRASAMPEGESLVELGAHHATMCIFLSGANLSQVAADLEVNYSPDTPVVLVYKSTWPQEKRWEGTLNRLLKEVDLSEWTLSTMLLVGDVLSHHPAAESKLYDAAYSHRYRKGARKQKTEGAGSA